MSALRVETITCSERLAALAPSWSDLWERCPEATPFQAPEWLLPWWEHLGRGRLCTLAVWRADRLVGLASLFVERYFHLPLWRLALLGTGNTDYLDVLLDPAESTPVLQALQSAIQATPIRWDFCDLQQLRVGTALLGAAVPPSFRHVIREQEVCPVLTLPAVEDPVVAVLPVKLRSNLRYYQRRLEREGGTFALADSDTVGEALEALFQLHGARWRKRKLPGVFTSPRVRRFHHEAAQRFAQRGWLRLHTLSLGGRFRAVLYCFHCRNRGYYYAGGFDPALARLSPGTVLTGRAVQSAADEGAREFDFLRGDEPYKYTWAAVNRTNYRCLYWRERSAGAVAPRLTTLEHRLECHAKRFARWLQRHAAS
jgi:CelD/BcsL family acetyltransferase involved in cellulose biosynthesis